jgi:CRP-like cAMP-binding protein
MSNFAAQTVLENNPLLSLLEKDERTRLWQNANVLSFKRHQVIYKPGQDTSSMYLLLKGSAKITVHTRRKDIIKYLVQPGFIFGESALTGEQERRDYAYAMENNAEVLVLDCRSVLGLMRNNFAFAQAILHYIGERLRYTENQLEKVVVQDSKTRIMEFLFQMGKEQGKKVGFEILVRHNMTHQDIADLTGTSRQMVTAVLNQLKRDNLLYFNRKKILFRDLAALPVDQ